MYLQQNISLKPYNSFGIDEQAAHYTELSSLQDLKEISALPYRKYVLGGGSNILLTQPITGLVVRSCLAGIKIVKEDADYIFVEVQSGELWHSFVMYAVQMGWGGIENLALIPGCVGAAPIQNIGAYGAEVKESIDSVCCWLWKEGRIVKYDNSACSFGYRDSIFKNELKNEVFVISVIFRLRKNPAININYGSIADELKKMNVQYATINDVAQAVIHIRKSKLPDPKVIGNAGSFFKNPLVLMSHLEALKVRYDNIPSYPVDKNCVKIPAGWLIERCGWKGYHEGQVGVHEKQALVLVNYGNAHGSDIWNLSEQIFKSVQHEFNITLEREVEKWGE